MRLSPFCPSFRSFADREEPIGGDIEQYVEPATEPAGVRGIGATVDNMKPPSGIGGLDPRKHASARVGERNVELAADAIGRKARELLASLPEEHRAFRLKAVSPEHWWLI